MLDLESRKVSPSWLPLLVKYPDQSSSCETNVGYHYTLKAFTEI